MKKHILTILIIASSLVAQFNTFSCFKDLRHIKESDRFHFDDIEEDINNFFTLNQLSGNIDYLDIDGSLHLKIESIVEANNQKIVNANDIITN